MKKLLIKLGIHEEKVKQKSMKAVSGLSGVVSVEVDMKDKNLTLKGDIDPICVMDKLKKVCHAQMIYFGPAIEEKKDEPKMKEDVKKDSTNENVINPIIYGTHGYYNPQYSPYYYCRGS